VLKYPEKNNKEKYCRTNNRNNVPDGTTQKQMWSVRYQHKNARTREHTRQNSLGANDRVWQIRASRVRKHLLVKRMVASTVQVNSKNQK